MTDTKDETIQLTRKQEAFAVAYAKSGNATQAYRDVYDTSGMKEATINRAAKALTDHYKVSTRIEQLRGKIRAKADEAFDMSIEKLLTLYVDIATLDPGELYSWDENGNLKLKPSDQLTPRQRRMVASIVKSTGNTNSLEIKRLDPMKAMESIAKHLGFYELDNAQQAAVTITFEDERT